MKKAYKGILFMLCSFLLLTACNKGGQEIEPTTETINPNKISQEMFKEQNSRVHPLKETEETTTEEETTTLSEEELATRPTPPVKSYYIENQVPILPEQHLYVEGDLESIASNGHLVEVMLGGTQVKEKDLKIHGLIIVGSNHQKEPEKVKNEETGEEREITVFDKGYAIKMIDSSFYQGEFINLYEDASASTFDNTAVIFCPKQDISDFLAMTYEEIVDYAYNNNGAVIEGKTPDTSKHGFVGRIEIPKSSEIGKYIILFTNDKIINYYMTYSVSEKPVQQTKSNKQTNTKKKK